MKIMVEERVLKKCQEEIRQRLKKYDVVNMQKDKKEIDGRADNGGGKNREVKMDLLYGIFGNPIYFWFTTYIDSRAELLYKKKDVPEAIKDTYLQAEENLKFLYDGYGYGYIYMKDVLRAVAYHEYVSSFELNMCDIECGTLFFAKEDYRNLPIDLEVYISGEEGKSSLCAFPAIGGGLLSKEYINKKDCQFKNIFKKENSEFGDSGNYQGKKSKGVKYELLYERGKEITDKIGSAADIWFFKNVFDPELFTSIYLAIEKRNICEYDYSLIWTLCKCKYPTMRLYIFKAIEPCYIYIETLKQKREVKAGYMMILLERVERFIISINKKLRSLVNETARCFEENAIDCETLIKAIGLDKAFLKGDDFPFVYARQVETVQLDVLSGTEAAWKSSENYVPADEQKVNTQVYTPPKEETIDTKYYQYMLEEVEPSMNKIEYAVITALNEQWIKSEEDYQENISETVELEGNFEKRVSDYTVEMLSGIFQKNEETAQ